MRLVITCVLIVLATAGFALAGLPADGCCLRTFERENGDVTFCTQSTSSQCFLFAGVGVTNFSFESGKFCAPDGMSCVGMQPTGLEVGIGLGRTPGAVLLGDSILVYPSFDRNDAATIRNRVVNHTTSTLTHVTVRIFVGDQEVRNEENVPFTSVPHAGFQLDTDTTLPERSELVGSLFCYATGEMGEGDCPEYPTEVTGDHDADLGGAAQDVEVFIGQAYGVFLQVAGVRPAPVVDVAATILLAALIMAIETRRRRHGKPPPALR